MRSSPGSAPSLRLLMLDSDPDAAQTLVQELVDYHGDTLDVTAVRSGREALDMLRGGKFDLIAADLDSLADLDLLAEEAVSRLARLAQGALIVAISTGRSVSSAVAAMRAGAHDYVAKPVSGAMFAARVEELAERHGPRGGYGFGGLSSCGEADFAGFIGTSGVMRSIYEQIVRIAPSPAPVFITGESGTGKEICAEALHKMSPRGGKPFIAVNCGAIPRELMEAELFGAARGAYTGAVKDRAGAAELAEGGTLFLDEIGELDLPLQTKLLRFLQTGQVTRIGESKARAVDVRIVCATNRNPMQMISEKGLREDLFYRLHVLPIHLPPLRQRSSDIPRLARHLLGQYAESEGKSFEGIPTETANMLMARGWPGNVRQLQNLIRRIVVMFDGGVVTARMVEAADIEAHATGAIASLPVPLRSARQVLPMWQQEQRIIEDTISLFRGNIAQAAAALEISPSTIYRKRLNWEQMARQISGAA